MKKLMFFSVVVFLLSSIFINAQPFGPPLYIADPASMNCRYYFAGDQRHFNPRPENYTINVAYVTDMKSEQQACDFFRCVHTNGSVKVDNNKKPIESDMCVCPQNTRWDLQFGCVKIQKQKEATFLQAILDWLKRILGIK